MTRSEAKSSGPVTRSKGRFGWAVGADVSGPARPALTYALEVRPTAVRVRLLSFGPWRARLPEGGVWRELPAGGSVADLLETLQSSGLFEETALRAAAVAVNQEYVRRSRVLADGDEVAILPPVSGGTQGQVAIVREPIEADAIMRRIKAGGDGAVCVFDGIVRDNTRGRQTLHLDYEAYEEMALKEMEILRQDALQKFGVREIFLVHRLGRLLVGETSVLIAVASAHRGVAFDACRWVIDTLKKTVPIWKHEQFVDGALWADGEAFPDDLVGESQ